MFPGKSLEELVTNLGLGVLAFLAATITGIALERSMSKSCGDFSGNWYASAIGSGEAPQGVFQLRSDGCEVVGSMDTATHFVSLIGEADRTRGPHTATLTANRRNHATGDSEAMDVELTLVASGARIFFEIMPEATGSGGSGGHSVQYLLTEVDGDALPPARPDGQIQSAA